jgi:LysR family transcriptional activator for leuABCD operon
MASHRVLINFAEFDLNLLKVFDVIMQERNLTRAAERLGKSPAGTSHALRRLREELGDELFETPGRGMVPTRRALEIAPCISKCLGQLRVGLNSEPGFDPRTARRLFTIDMPVGTDLFLAGPLQAYAEKHAPGITFQILSDRAAVLQAELRYGETEIAIDHEPLDDDEMRSEVLYQDPFVLVSRRNHPKLPAGTTVDRALFQSLQHIGLSWTRSKDDGTIAHRLLRIGLDRDLRMKVPTVGAAVATIAQSDLVCSASRRVANYFARHWPVDLHRLEIDLPPVPIHMVWHSRYDGDPGHAWLRQAVRAAADAI